MRVLHLDGGGFEGAILRHHRFDADRVSYRDGVVLPRQPAPLSGFVVEYLDGWVFLASKALNHEPVFFGVVLLHIPRKQLLVLRSLKRESGQSRQNEGRSPKGP